MNKIQKAQKIADQMVQQGLLQEEFKDEFVEGLILELERATRRFGGGLGEIAAKSIYARKLSVNCVVA